MLFLCGLAPLREITPFHLGAFASWREEHSFAPWRESLHLCGRLHDIGSSLILGNVMTMAPELWKRPALMLFLSASLAGAAVSATPGAGSDWPRFLGPNGDATSPETGLLDGWGKEGPPLDWSREVGTGYGAPSVRESRLVLHHRMGPAEIVEAMDAVTGKTEWRHGYPSAYVDPYGYNNGPRCTPLLTEDYCYTFGAEGRLLCLGLKTGTVVWQRETARDWTIPEAFFGVGSTPVLEGNRLIVMVGGQPNSGVVALDPDTGKTLWESVGKDNWEGVPKKGWPGEAPVVWSEAWKQASYSSPVAATIHGQRHILCLMRQGLVSLNPTNGHVNFSFWFQSRVNESVNAMNPVVQDDLILISGAYYKVGSVLLRVAPDGASAEEIWRNTSLEQHWMTPLLVEGNLYAFSGRNEPDAELRCVEFATGELKWNRNERWATHSSKQPDAYGRGSGIRADGKFIVLGEGGLLGLFRFHPSMAEELARHQVPALHYPCWAAPVLSRGRVYLRSEDHLVCYNLTRPRS